MESETPTVEQANEDSLRENIAYLSQKMSSSVRIQRWASSTSPIIGPPVIIIPLKQAAENLADSGFMRDWFISKILEHLSNGGSFTNQGKKKQDYEPAIVSNGESLYLTPRSEYRLASEKEVLDYVDHEQFASVTGHAVSRRAQEKGYLLHYHEGPMVIEDYDRLPRQAKTVLDILNETGREDFTEASIELLLTGEKDRLKTKQDPMKIFAFYRRRLIDGGHLEEVE